MVNGTPGDRGIIEKVRVLEIVGDWCESLHVCSRSCKKEEGKRLGLQVQRDLR